MPRCCKGFQDPHCNGRRVLQLLIECRKAEGFDKVMIQNNISGLKQLGFCCRASLLSNMTGDMAHIPVPHSLSCLFGIFSTNPKIQNSQYVLFLCEELVPPNRTLTIGRIKDKLVLWAIALHGMFESESYLLVASGGVNAYQVLYSAFIAKLTTNHFFFTHFYKKSAPQRAA